jgi:drug/metabolite transporter, DME family
MEPSDSMHKHDSSRKLLGMSLIASAAFCWGASATVGKIIFNGYFAHATPISPLVLSQTRTTFSFLILAPLLLLTGQGQHFHTDRRSFIAALLVGVLGVAGANFFYYDAIQRTSITLAIVIQYLAPVWVLLYMLARRQQQATLRRISGVLLAVSGIALAIGLGSGPLHLNPLGTATAFLAGISFALYNIGGSVLSNRMSSATLLLYAMLGSAIFWAVVHPLWTLARTPYSRGEWIFLVAFAVGSMLIPYLLYFTGLRYLDATSAIVTSCLEPVFAILLATTFVHETIRPLQALGIVMVLAATILIQTA